MNKYKISLRVKKPIPKSYFTTILANYEHYFNTASNCSILLDNDITIHYLDIYLNDLIDIETFIEICLILSFIKFNITDNIKMKDIKTNEIVYSLIPKFIKSNLGAKIKERKYIKLF